MHYTKANTENYFKVQLQICVNCKNSTLLGELAIDLND